jgi:hypothetical protein
MWQTKFGGDDMGSQKPALNSSPLRRLRCLIGWKINLIRRWTRIDNGAVSAKLSKLNLRR